MNDVDLKYGDTGKDVNGDFNEMDNGAKWNIPQPGKRRPARKVLMLCRYRKTEQLDDTGDDATRETVTLPPSARSCKFETHLNAK